MKQRIIATVATLAVLFFVATIGAAPISAQEQTPIPDVPVPTPTPDLDQRVGHLEEAQTQTVESLKQINEQNRFITTVITGIIAVLVAVQSLATGIQLHREGRRDDRQADREKERDRLDLKAAEQVSNIMNVVQQTLASRLASEEQMQQLDRTSIRRVSDVMRVVQQTLASRLEIESTGITQVSEIMNVVRQTLESHLQTEEQAREMVTKAEKELEESLRRLRPLQQFYQKFQATIKMSRQAIEEHAFQLAQISRHDFKRQTNELNSLARQIDTFKAEFEALEEEPCVFSARVPYIRGIAALYANQPEIAKQNLEEVIQSRKPELDEGGADYKSRIANAYYYLGVTESNFGNHEDAITSFENVNRLDLHKPEFLTRIVTAEAYVMMDDFDTARRFITEVEEGLGEIERESGRLHNYQLRLRSRAALIRANMAILERGADWHLEVQQSLKQVSEEDPYYYYATVTLAQIHHDQGTIGKAQELFHQAYESIERSGHLLTVTEGRSKILLLMVAGMCCKHGLTDEKRAEQHLEEADHLRDNLPRMGPQVYKVFSTLSKRNESSDTIRRHIELIRRGKVLL
jgi:tetratricopeptide (TPR) repeat protein